MVNPWDGHRFVLPLPTRANALVRPALMFAKGKPTARLVKTLEGETWLGRAHAELRRVHARLGSPAPLAGPVRFEAKFFFASIASDGDGRLKALQDAISGYAYEDDRQIGDWVLAKRIVEMLSDDPKAPLIDRERVEVVVVDLTGDPEHEELEYRLLIARKRKLPGRRLGLQSAVYR